MNIATITEDFDITLNNLETIFYKNQAHDIFMKFIDKYNKRHITEFKSARDYDTQLEKVFVRYVRRWYL